MRGKSWEEREGLSEMEKLGRERERVIEEFRLGVGQSLVPGKPKAINDGQSKVVGQIRERELETDL